MKKGFLIAAMLLHHWGAILHGQAVFEKIFRIGNQSTEVCALFPQSDGYMVLSRHGRGIVNFSKFDKTGAFVTGKDVFDCRGGFVMRASMTPSGDFLVTGVANEDAANSNSRQTGFFLLVSPSLSVSGFTLVPTTGNGDSWASGAIKTSDGSLVVLAKSTLTSVGGVDNFFVVTKLNGSASEIIWQSSVLAGNDNTVFDIAETSSGYEIYGAIKHKDTGWNLYLGTISKEGTEMKRQLIVGGNDWDGAYDQLVETKRRVFNNASGIIRPDAGNLVVAASTRSFGSNKSGGGEKEGKSILLLSFPVTGNSYNWSALLDGPGQERVFGPFGTGNLIKLANGDLLLSGYTNSTGPGVPYPGGFACRFSATAAGSITPQWQHIFTPPGNFSPLGLSEAADGSLFITGGSGASSKEGILVQTTAAGISPAGCISAHYGNLTLQSIALPVMTTTNAALLGPTMNMPQAEEYSLATAINQICGFRTTEPAKAPVIGEGPESRNIAGGQTASLSVLATGTPPLRYQWYQGLSGDESHPVGLDSCVFLTPVLTQTTRFWVKISNAGGTIRSDAAVITVGDQKWSQSEWADAKQWPSALTLGADGTLLVTTQDVVTHFGPDDWPCSSPPGFLTALDPASGSVRWSLNTGHSAPPVADKAGVVYSNILNRLYAIHPATGITTLLYTADHNFTSSPALSADGTLFIGAGAKVMAISTLTGELIWEEPTDKFVIQHPSIGEDGIVYVIPWRMSNRMYAFYPHKTPTQLKWTAQISGLFSTPPAIGEKGTIYAGAGSKLVAIDPESGVVKWSFTTPIAPAGYPVIRTITSEPVVSNNGTIYFSASTGEGGALFALHPEGYPKWSFRSGLCLYTSPLLAKDGTILYPAEDLHMLDVNGKEQGSLKGAGSLTPVLADDGTLFRGSYDDNGVYALRTANGGLLTAHWPAAGHDPQRTGRYDGSFTGIAPSFTLQPENRLLKSGQTATFTVEASGDPVIRYQWFEGIAGDKSKPVGEDTTVLTTPPLTELTNYWVEAENNFGRDMSNTAIASTGNEGEFKWFFNTNPTFSKKEDGEITGGVALADDGTIYFGVEDARLFAIYPDGTVKWIAGLKAYENKYEIVNAIYFGTPVVGDDGTIYINTLGYYDEISSGTENGFHNFGYLWAIRPDGTEKWRYETGNSPAGSGSIAPWLRGSPAIGHDGTLYVASHDAVLHAVNPDGTLKWKFHAWKYKGYLRGLSGNTPAIGMDGTIYFTAGGEFLLNDMTSMEASLFAVRPDGSCKWDFLLLSGKVFYSGYSPAIGADGTIYADNGDGYTAKIFAIHPDGTEAWQFATGENTASPVVTGPDGTLYVGGSSYVNSASRIKLFALNPDGSEKWRYPKEGSKDKTGFSFAIPVVGADGNIYFGIPGDSDGHIYALRPDGSELWSKRPWVGNMPFSSLVIAPDGTLYVGTGEGFTDTFYGFLFAISTKAFGVANAAWPMLGRDPRRQYRAAGFPPCEAPLITLQPADTTLFTGEAVRLTVRATGPGLEYTWYQGSDRSKPVGTGDSFTTPDLEESAGYWVRAANSCGTADSRIAIVTVRTVGTRDRQTGNPGIRIFPNPAGKQVFIEGLGPGNRGGSVSLYDLHGRKVLEKPIGAGSPVYGLEVSRLTGGIYFVRVQTADHAFTGKLIVRH